jgi:hypothetical protein
MAERCNPVSTAGWQAWLALPPLALLQNVSFQPTGLGMQPVWVLAQMLTCKETFASSSQFGYTQLKHEGKEINTDDLVRQFMLES